MSGYELFGENVAQRLNSPLSKLEDIAGKAYGGTVLLATTPFLNDRMLEAAHSVGIDKFTGYGACATAALFAVSYITKGKNKSNIISRTAFKVGLMTGGATAGYYFLKRVFG